ncbi:MAG: YqjK-like family protein [Gallionella sp.]|nr:YqjK-like family protein [Gallionella sp.]
MKKRLAELACHRCELLEKIEAQRREMTNISMHWEKPLALVDTGLNAVRFIHNHPALVAGGVAALLALRRKGITGLVHEVWRLLCLYPATLFLAPRFSSEGRKAEIDD